MSTSALIFVDGTEIVLYKHWDGYPKATLKWLQDFNKQFTTSRGEGKDPAYKAAQLIRSSAFECDHYKLDNSRDTGWGVYTVNDVDHFDGIEWVYYLRPDGEVDLWAEGIQKASIEPPTFTLQ